MYARPRHPAHVREREPMDAPTGGDLVTLDTHLRGHVANGDHGLADVLAAIALAGKVIASKVRRARIEDVLGDVGGTNVFGESQQKLDVLADDLLRHFLSRRSAVAVIASEESEDPIVVRSAAEGGRFCVCFDPLDGSSNIDVGVGVGTIFGISPVREGEEPARSLLQPGTEQVAAGYVLYGSSVLFVYTTGAGVDMFVLDPHLGEFLCVASALRVPEKKKVYSLNEGYFDDFPVPYQRYLGWAHANGYSGRYIGSMVADVHRTLLKGGVFLYPPTASNPDGKLRLLYEANPLAFVMEQAGGVAAAGRERMLELKPRTIHQRVPVIMGSSHEVTAVKRELEKA
jgi:fructose-1,6-bisphosphatase I